jgi:arabinogalactan oligomer/maltooligosaccharide transport system substrate-binding protein
MRKFAAALIALLSLTSCTGSNEAAQSTSEAQGPTQNSLEGEVLKVWVDQELVEAFESIGEQLEINSGISFNLVVKDFYSIRTELQAVSASESPDLFVGANDQLDELLGLRLLAPVTYPNDFEPQPGIVSAFARAGQSYAVPYATENMALVCDASRVSRAPSEWSELTNLGVTIPLSPGGDPYLMQSFLSSFGAAVFASDDSGDYSAELTIGNAAGIEFASWLSSNSESFVELDYAAMLASLSSGASSCILTGPWALPTLAESVSFEMAVYPLPAIGGFDSKPFGASRGVFALAQSAKLDAVNEALSLIATPASQLLIYLNTGRPPVIESFANDIENSLMRGFMESARTSIPIPATSLMQFVWGPLGSAQMAILKQGGDPVVIWDEMALQIRAQIDPAS